MKNIARRKVIGEKLSKVTEAFCPILYEDDEIFLQNMRGKALPEADIRKYQHWEWTQGVGLYGLWKLFMATREEKYLDILIRYFENQLAIGFPELNVNTVTPFLTMSYLGEYLDSERYLAPCRESAEWIMEHFPRTEEGGFQHMTSDCVNDQELWDDTLFMCVLFLANMGRIEGNRRYADEAQYQFLIHAKYLADTKSGLWYHGWTFKGRHNFAGAFWARGNCWITVAVPELLETIACEPAVRRTLTQLLVNQIDGLKRYQDASGMWHTLIDDADSYVEASASCGFGYGILRAVRAGLIGREYEAVALKALEPILNCVAEDGVVHQVSYGTAMGRESKEFYKKIELKPMPYGQALAMLFLAECLDREQ